ncbi:MAG TPA: enoyl-CoA hydratase-related protein [Microthrixaceae bacterium]|nr:enoyl-CoA hydratase-related protein [Microthrixaceae bacterium]
MLRYEVGDDHVARVTLDRADAANALTVEMRDDLVDAIRSARDDDSVRAVLVGAAGESFCSGMDLRGSTVVKAGTDGFDPRSTSQALRIGVQTFVRELWELDKPTVAAVNGPAVGPGAHLALSCDFVFVADPTRFMWSFARWGLVVDAGGAYLLPRLVGLPRARAMVMLGEAVEGPDAVAAGLAYRHIADVTEMKAGADELATRLAAGPTRSLGLSKRLLNRSFETDLSDSLELEGHFQALATASADLVEGMTSFREKRDPEFGGH